MNKHIFRIRKVKKLTEEDQNSSIKNLFKNRGKKFEKFSLLLKNKKPFACKRRVKINLSGRSGKGYWSKEEDELCRELVRKHGLKWIRIAKEMNTRTSKQIRERYLNVLDESLSKSKFSLEEDLKILELYSNFESNWKKYVPFLPGRSAGMIKNRYHSSIKRNKNVYFFIKSLEGQG